MPPSAPKIARQYLSTGPIAPNLGVSHRQAGDHMDRKEFFRRWGPTPNIRFDAMGNVHMSDHGQKGAIQSDLKNVERIARSSPRFTTRVVPNPKNIAQFQFEDGNILATKSWGVPIEKFSWNPVTGEIVFVRPPEHHRAGNAPFDDYVRAIVLHDRKKVLFRPFWPSWMQNTPYDTFDEEAAAVSFDAQWHAKEMIEENGGRGWDIEMNTNNRALAEMTGQHHW